MSDHIKSPGQLSTHPGGGGFSSGGLIPDIAAPNAYRLLWAGFTAILAAGVGFAIRGGILGAWGAEFGFTGEEIGRITGGGFTGFCFGIIIGGLIADKIGYGKLVIAAFALHVVSAAVTLYPGNGGYEIQANMPKATVYEFLFWGSFLFAFANGTLEAVANPLVATLFPSNRTHYLNILHASWPLGLVVGGAAGWVLGGRLEWPWKWQLALYLVPTLIYGVMFLGQAMPKSEASKRGLSLGEMFKDVGLLGGLVVCFLLSMFFSGVLTPLVTPKDPNDPQMVASVETKLADAREQLTREGSKGDIEEKALTKLTADEKQVYESSKQAKEKAKQISQYVDWAGYAFGGVLLILVGVITRFSIGSFLLFVLFVAHALVGAVELGTDNWIQNITGNILTTEQGRILFVFTSLIMFGLRFCADFIEKRLGMSPITILVTCAILACAGLLLTSRVNTFVIAMLALTVYAVGKTFFWPTMLAVASDRFPRTGAVAISIMGGIGMMSAGLIGAPGLGYAKDRFSGEALQTESAVAFKEYQAEKPSKFLFFGEALGLDGKKLGAVQKKVENARLILETGKVKDLDEKQLEKLSDKAREEARKEHAQKLVLLDKLKEAGVWKEGGGGDPKDALVVLTPAEKAVFEASIEGDRRTLVADAAIPATMALIYLALLIYFKTIGGYRPVQIGEEDPKVAAAAHAGEG